MTTLNTTPLQINAFSLSNRFSNGHPFRVLSLCILFLSCIGTQQVFATNPPSITHSTSFTLASQTTCNITELFQGNPVFEGRWSAVSVDVSNQSITYTLNGGNGNALPGNTDIAEITVIDPDGGPDKFLLVITDGGGTLMVLDDY